MRSTLGAVVALLLTASGLLAAVALANGGQDKVVVCHKPDNQSIELTVGDPAIEAHLGHGDTLGPCEGDPPPTTTEPPPTTTEPPPTTTEPPPPPPTTAPPPGGGGSTGSAGVFCDFDHYVVTGTVDGQAIDFAVPATIPGNYLGWTNVTLWRGDTDFRTAVFTYGDCLGAATAARLSSLSRTRYAVLRAMVR